MKTSSFRRLAVTAAALLGCFVAAVPAQAREAECDQGNCTITITVNACRITVDPDTVIVRSARHMHWVIATDGYEFADNGIEFGHPQFEKQGKLRPREFHFHNHKSQAGDFPYSVNVTDSNGRPCQGDPTVRNTN